MDASDTESCQEKQVKVAVWSIPRSASTIFAKCLCGIKDIVVFSELFSWAGASRARICDSQTIQLWGKFRAIWLVEKLFTTRPQLKLLHNTQVQYVHAIELHTTGILHAQLALANTFAA